ncbi:MAG: class I SAM-dependent methyltransferase [Candidatus Parcubacteria bacterium]|nr:class I SAM-dependent methyltransferase [Candidatus Parcubacteria bacterium]
MKKTITQIRKHWNSEAEKHEDPMETMLDKILNKMELNSIAKYLPVGKKILDAGCGNGHSMILLAKARKSQFFGCDYADKAVFRAKQGLEKESAELQKRVSFSVGDIRNLPFKNNTFDAATTDRVLINFLNINQQIVAAKEISRVLKKGGRYIMCEDSQEGMDNINKLRKIVGLEPLQIQWHNLFINEKKFLAKVRRFLKLEAIDNFSSTYFIGSRIFNAKLAAMDGKKPEFNHQINQIASQLPPIGDYSPLKIFIFKK